MVQWMESQIPSPRKGRRDDRMGCWWGADAAAARVTRWTLQEARTREELILGSSGRKSSRCTRTSRFLSPPHTHARCADPPESPSFPILIPAAHFFPASPAARFQQLLSPRTRDDRSDELSMNCKGRRRTKGKREWGKKKERKSLLH